MRAGRGAGNGPPALRRGSGLPQTAQEPALEARQAQAFGSSHVGHLPGVKGRERFLKELNKNWAGAGEQLVA